MAWEQIGADEGLKAEEQRNKVQFAPVAFRSSAIAPRHSSPELGCYL